MILFCMVFILNTKTLKMLTLIRKEAIKCRIEFIDLKITLYKANWRKNYILRIDDQLCILLEKIDIVKCHFY